MKRTKKINLIREQRAKRTRAKIRGTAEKPRLSIFRSNKFIYAQLIDDGAGRTVAAVMIKKGVKAAGDLGTKIAELAKKASIKKAVFDRGPYQYHGQVKALAEAARAGGLNI